MTLLDYIIIALAVHRLTRLVTTDTVLNPLRERIWAKRPINKGIGYLITCVWCTSFWASSLVFTMYKIFPEPAIFACTVLSLSSIAGFISRVE